MVAELPSTRHPGAVEGPAVADGPGPGGGLIGGAEVGQTVAVADVPLALPGGPASHRPIRNPSLAGWDIPGPAPFEEPAAGCGP